jgi:hypothetical protein
MRSSSERTRTSSRSRHAEPRRGIAALRDFVTKQSYGVQINVEARDLRVHGDTLVLSDPIE